MNVLAIDTASICAVAVARTAERTVERRRDFARGHAEALLPMIQQAMDEADLAFEALDLIAAAVGPGSFTGLRTGLAAARGLALALDKPMHGVSSLMATARGAAAHRAILIALDSKRAEIYAQAFDSHLAPLSEPMLRLPEEIPLLMSGLECLAGDAAERLRGITGADLIETQPGNAADIAAIAASERDAGIAGLPLRPLYLSPPLATAPGRAP
jgi:tRNA threonylcarbamoyl adenosine modification protein YeaZ